MDIDEQLVEKYLKGDENAFEQLVQKYTVRIYNFVSQYINSSQEAEDLVQEVFIKTWRSIKKFDTSKKFKPWLFRITRNTVFDYLRKLRITPLVYFEDEENFNLDSLPDDVSSQFEHLAESEQFIVIQKKVSQLPEIYRVVLNLYYLEELSLAEIAEVLNEPIDTIKSRHRRALFRLRKILNEDQKNFNFSKMHL